jgi:hypothetical protein
LEFVSKCISPSLAAPCVGRGIRFVVRFENVLGSLDLHEPTEEKMKPLPVPILITRLVLLYLTYLFWTFRAGNSEPGGLQWAWRGLSFGSIGALIVSFIRRRSSLIFICGFAVTATALFLFAAVPRTSGFIVTIALYMSFPALLCGALLSSKPSRVYYKWIEEPKD